MLITKSNAKKAGKKLLSVLLAVVMIMTSMSVCFGTFTPAITASAVDTATAVSEFVAAANAYCAVSSFKDASTAETNNGKTGANLEKTKTWTFKTTSYAEYQLLKAVIVKLDVLVKSLDEYTKTHTHNNGALCSDGWYADNTQANKCSDWGYVKDALVNSLGTNYATLKAYGIDKLLDATLNYDLVPTGDGNPAGAQIRPTNGETTDWSDSSTEDGAPKKIFNVVVIEAPSTSAKEVVNAAKSLADIPEEINTSVKYTLGLSRQNYQTSSKDSCNNVTTTNHYHMAINTNETGEPKVEDNGSTSTGKAVLTAVETAYGTTYKDYFATTDKSGVLAISDDEAVLTEVLSNIKSVRSNAEEAFGKDVYTTLFSSYAYDSTVKNIEDALKFLGFGLTIEEINTLMATDYSDYTTSEIAQLLASLQEAYSGYTGFDEATKAEVAVNFPDFKPTDVEAKIAEIRAAYEKSLIKDKIGDIEAHLLAYEGKWTIEDVDDDKLTYNDAWTACQIVKTDYETLKDLDRNIIAELCGNDFYARVEALYEHLAYLSTAANYNEDYTPRYNEFFNTIQTIVPDQDTETLFAALKQYDNWYAELRELIDDMKEDLGETNANLLYDEVNDDMTYYMDHAYAVLNGRLETQIDNAYDLYELHETMYGPTVHYVSLESYLQISESIGKIENDVYDFIKNTPNFTIAPATVEKYEALQALLLKYDEFAKDRGFETFYQLKVADFEREDTLDDQFRQNSNKDDDAVGEYITTDEQINKVITVIDAALTNESVSSALGFNLGEMLTKLVEDAVLSDSLINTVVEMLYPLVLKEFGKVFANDLPSKEGDNDVTYKKGLHTVLSDAKFQLYPDLLASLLEKTDNKDAYSDTIDRLIAAYDEYKLKYPNAGADKYDAYGTAADPEKVGQTNKLGTEYVILSDTPWDSMQLRDPETGKMNLSWGIDAAKANGVKGDALKALFYETFDDAVEGLKPLLLAIVANKEWTADTSKNLAVAGPKIEAADVDLNLGATANSGYANLIVPLFEALGIFDYTDVSKIEGEFLEDSKDDVEKIVKAIFDPIFEFVDDIGDAPLSTILGILPNLCYTLSAGMLKPLLGMLKTNIWYLAPITIKPLYANCGVAAPAPPSGNVAIDVGDMLKIPALDNIYAEGINGVITLLGIEGLPRINQELIACLGELTIIKSQRKDAVYSSLDKVVGYVDGDLSKPILEFDGKAYHIEADKVDVLSYLAEYLLTAVGTDGVLDSVLGAFAKEGEEPVVLSETILTIISNIATDPAATIAAIVELFNFSEYETKMLYTWFEDDNYQASTVVGFNPATEIYLNVNNDWTKEKADYLYDNLDTIIGAVVAMIPSDDKSDEEATETIAEDENLTQAASGLADILGDLVNGIYTNKTLTALARILSNLDLNSLINSSEESEEATPETPEAPETVDEGEETGDEGKETEKTEEEKEPADFNALVRDLLGVDLSVYAAYKDIPSAEEDPEYVHPDFTIEDGNSDEFIAELVELLKPLSKVLGFLLTGDEITVFDGDAEVTLFGGDGYNDAIIPLLEAIGCDPEAADTGVAALEAILKAIAARIDKLLENPVEEIFDIIAGLVYFLTSNALSTTVLNLLKPALVVLETIRPIYDLDIGELIGGLLEKDETTEGEDETATVADDDSLEISLRLLDANFVVDLVSKLTGLNLTGLKVVLYDVAGALEIKEYDSASTLQETFKTAEFSDDFDQADLLTVVLSYVVEWIAQPQNAESLDKLLGKEGMAAAITNIISGAEILYATPNWMYFFDTEAEFLEAVANGMVIESTLAALEYPNDWNKDTAEYIADNLAGLVDMVIALINKDKEGEPTTLKGILENIINPVFTAESLNKIVELIAGLLENVSDELLAAGGYLLNVDILGLKAYTAPENVDTIDEFADELAKILKFIPGLVELLFLGESYEFFNTSSGEDSIVISGGNGYAEGLALILEALGCENLPAADGETADIIDGIFDSLADRINDILADPVNEILELLPNIIFFLNANGLGVALGNILKPVNALLDKINLILEKPISIADLLKIQIKDENGEVTKEASINLELLSVENVVELVESLTELDLAIVEEILVNFCVGMIETYDSVSVNDAYKMTGFTKKDTVTILLTIALIFVSDEDNAAALDEMLGTEIVSAIKSVFESAPVVYADPDWYAIDWDDVDYESMSAGVIQSALTYPNDWTEAKSLYLVNNLPALVDTVISLLEIDGTKYENLDALIDAKVNIYTPELLEMIKDALNDLLSGLGEDLQDLVNVGFNVANKLLDADIQGLKDYDVTGVNNKETFIAALTGMLMEVEGIVEWLLLGRDFELFVDDKNNNDEYDAGEAIITINGAEGYAEGLALLLEALGVEDLPAADGETEKIISGVLTAIFDRVDTILANPVDEVVNILPNVIYFINANGLSAAVNNLAGAFNALAIKLKGFGLDIELKTLVNIEKLLNIVDEENNVKDLAIGLDNLTLAAVLELVEELTGLDLTGVAEIFEGFALGRVQGYTGVNGKLNAMMVYDEGENGKFNKADMLTLIVTAALLVVETEGNAEALNELIGTDIISAVKNVFAASEITYAEPEWDYCWDENGNATGDTIPVIDSAIEYPNDWTAEKSAYLAENLPTLVDTVVQLISKDENADLSGILTSKVNVFTAKTLNDLVAVIADLIGGIDAGLLDVAGIVLNVDLNGLMEYEAPESVDTVEEFAEELAAILTNYAGGVVEWLLLGNDYTFFVNDADKDAEYDEGEDIITINGAHGYAEGLALLLEALGCENLPTVYDGAYTTEEIVSGVLASLAARIDEIFANPVEEVLDLLPNLLYFLNTNGVAAVVDNLLAALTALSVKLADFDIDLDVATLVNLKAILGLEETDASISLDNITVASILEAVSLMTELDLEVLEDVLVGFALGKIEKYDSVSASDAYKMIYADEFDKHDMITVLVTAVLIAVVENEDNAAKLDEMLNTNIIAVLKDVFASSEITYTTPDWEYPLADNGTVDAMKYSITYPNNWTKETAQYVTETLTSAEFDALIAGFIENGKYESLSALLNDKVNVFTSANLQAVVDVITNLLADIDDGLLDAAGVLLGADVVELKKYKVPEGITTVDAFATELASVLNTYAKGLVEWLLLGNDYTFFVKDVDENGVPVDMITINGANGYAEGLALLLEALGCEDLPAADGNTEDIVSGALASLAARINEIFANPVVEVIDLLPNLLYFLNANGVAAVIDNTLAAVTALLDKLEVFGIEVDINELVNIKSLMKIEDTDAKISLDDLSMDAVLEAVSYMIDGLDLTLIKDVLVGFALGKVDSYDSVSASDAYKMTYADEFDKHDMVTVLVNLVLITIADENNAEFVKGLIGEDIYGVIIALFNTTTVPMQDFNWMDTENADTDYVYSAVNSSEMYKDFEYGPHYTVEMAQYIADNFGEFVNNVIYLLGIQINGEDVNTLVDLINGLLNGSVYNSKNVVAIRDAIAGVLAGVADLEVNGVNVGKYIVEVLKTAGIADITAVADVDVPEFSKDREAFVNALCDVLAPLYNILKYLLVNEDLTFFVDLDKNDAITLKGAEGYAYGIIPLLEVFDCQGILTPEEYYAAVEADGSALLTSIINPLLNRVDAVLAGDPAQEILNMLPNIIYFINSNGIDTVVKNTLNAVYALLAAIEPIAVIDLYDIIGIDLATLDFDTLFNMVLDLIAEKTGYRFEDLNANAIKELSVGKLVTYTSKNGKLAYRMIYDGEGLSVVGGKSEMVTVVLRLIVTFIMHEKNQEMLLGLLRDKLGMSADAELYVGAVLSAIAKSSVETRLGMDSALATLYYIFYGADIGVGNATNGLKDLNKEWTTLLKGMQNSKDEGEALAGDIITGILDLDIFDDIIDPDEGIAPNGLIKFFNKISEFFKGIVEFFKNLFSFGK